MHRTNAGGERQSTGIRTTAVMPAQVGHSLEFVGGWPFRGTVVLACVQQNKQSEANRICNTVTPHQAVPSHAAFKTSKSTYQVFVGPCCFCQNYYSLFSWLSSEMIFIFEGRNMNEAPPNFAHKSSLAKNLICLIRAMKIGSYKKKRKCHIDIPKCRGKE